MVTPKNCSMFERCSAPLCPLDPDLKHQVWFPDEDICNKPGFLGEFYWIKIQKKIKKRAKNRETMFTAHMMGKLVLVRAGVKGLDPEIEDANEASIVWLKKRGIFDRDIKKALIELSEQQKKRYSPSRLADGRRKRANDTRRKSKIS